MGSPRANGEAKGGPLCTRQVLNPQSLTPPSRELAYAVPMLRVALLRKHKAIP